MKKFFPLIGLFVACVAVADNLVVNADFQKIGTNGLPSGWNVSKKETARRVETAPGTHALELKGETCFWIQHGVKIEPEKRYRLSVRVKAAKGSTYDVYLESNKPVFKAFGSGIRTGNGQWQQVRYQFSYDQLERAPYLVFRLRKGEALFADPVVSESGGVFDNGDFEKASEGWTLGSGCTIAAPGGRFGKVLELRADKAGAIAAANFPKIALEGAKHYLIRYEAVGSDQKALVDTMGATWFRVYPELNGKAIPGTDEWRDCFSGWQKKSVRFFMPEDGLVTIRCEVRGPGLARLDNITLEPTLAIDKKLEIALDAPCSFRNGAYPTQKMRRFSGRVFITTPGVRRLDILFNGGSRSIALRGDAASFEFPVPAKQGIYPIKVVAKDADGKSLAETALDFTVYPGAEREVTFDRHHVMHVNGKPFFPIGVWGAHGSKTISEKAREWGETGFNCWRTTSDNLDLAQANGLYIIAGVCETFPKYVQNDPALLKRWKELYAREFVRLKDHPAMLCYFVSDEPAWRGVAPEGIREVYNFIRSLDPWKPIALNEAPRGKVEDLRRYNDIFDVYGIDIYPVPGPNSHSELSDKMMTSVGKYTDICHEVVRNSKPVWMTLQGFSWGALTGKTERGGYPTEAENRFMAYNALLHGATGLLYYGINERKDNPEFLKLLSRTIREIRAISPVLVTPPVAAKITGNAPELRMMRRNLDGVDYYFIINESGKNIDAVFKGSFPKKLAVLFENRSIHTDGKTFADAFKPYDVHVYAERAELPGDLAAHKLEKVAAKRPADDGFYRNADWIWAPGKNRIPGHRAFFKREIKLDKPLRKVEAVWTADDYYKLFINGALAGDKTGFNAGWNLLDYYDFTKLFRPGVNKIEIEAADGGQAPSGLLGAFKFTFADGSALVVPTDREYLVAEKSDGPFVPAEALCRFGAGVWGNNIRVVPNENRTLGKIDF